MRARDGEASLHRRAVFAGGAVLLLVVFAVLISRSRDSSRPTVSVDRSAAVQVGPADRAEERAGMDVGHARDDEGAVAAALSFATASQRWLYFTDEEVEAAVRAIALPAEADGLVATVVQEVSAARAELGESPGRVWWLVRPLGWALVSRSDDRATVEVWAVTVLSAVEVAAPQAEWRTFTVDLSWVGDDWALAAIRSTPGPTPMVGPGDRPWDAIPFDRALEGFTRLDGEPVR